VTYAEGPDEIDRREISSLVSASELMRTRRLKIITWDCEGTLRKDGRDVEAVPLWKWLLAPGENGGQCIP